jgi:glycosyltransferase involved in cell wall biosynthesis
MTEDVDISFIVLTYNRPDALLVVLRALATQCGKGHEILIADDGSNAASVQTLKSEMPFFNCPVRHVWHPDRGFTASRARNLGVCNSEGRYLIFLDGDCVPNRHFVAAHTALAEAGYFVNGNRVLCSQGFTQHILTQQVNLVSATIMDWVHWRFQGAVNKLAHLLYWPDAPGRNQKKFYWKKIRSCNFAVWKSDYVLVNGFDETFEGWGHEDADLVLRLHNSGLIRKNGYLCTEVYHLWHQLNSRGNESANYQRVLERMKSNLVKASQGLLEANGMQDVHVTLLN